MNEPLPLPPLRDAQLDDATASQLLNDLRDHAQVITILAKGATDAHADQRTLTLDDARTIIASRSARGLQIRYRWDAQAWCDTLMIPPSGPIRIVRIRVDDVFGG